MRVFYYNKTWQSWQTAMVARLFISAIWPITVINYSWPIILWVTVQFNTPAYQTSAPIACYYMTYVYNFEFV